MLDPARDGFHIVGTYSLREDIGTSTPVNIDSTKDVTYLTNYMII
jgi:hypothetical protein